MKKLILVSDTHLKEWNIPKRLEDLMKNSDFVVHAGDFDNYSVYKKFSEYDLIAVHGDSDDKRVKSELPDVRVLKLKR